MPRRGFQQYEDLANFQFPNPRSGRYFGKVGQQRYTREKESANKEFEIRKLLAQKHLQEEDRAAREGESENRFQETQDEINNRSFKPYEVATDSAYNLLASTPMAERTDEFGMKLPLKTGRTRGESQQMLVQNFPKANLGDPRIKELLGKRPTSYNDVEIEQPFDWRKKIAETRGTEPGGGSSMLGGLQGFMRDIVSKGVSGLKSIVGSKTAAPQSAPTQADEPETPGIPEEPETPGMPEQSAGPQPMQVEEDDLNKNYKIINGKNGQRYAEQNGKYFKISQ